MILPTILFLKHQNKDIFVIELINSRIWLTLNNSVVIFLASDTYAASLTSAASEISMASMTFKTLFSLKKNPVLYDFIPPATKMTNTGPFLWIGSLKSRNFPDI
jgi:hypothetical protein